MGVARRASKQWQPAQEQESVSTRQQKPADQSVGVAGSSRRGFRPLRGARGYQPHADSAQFVSKWAILDSNQ